jgi:hypothetical protein
VGCSRKAARGPRKAVRSRPCSRTSFWMSWIASLSVAATGVYGTRMTVTSTSLLQAGASFNAEDGYGGGAEDQGGAAVRQ